MTRRVGRPPLAVGTFGKFEFLTVKPGRVRARARYRDFDGVVRAVTKYGPSRPRAEAALREALRDRTTPTSGQLHGDSTVSELAALWLEEIRARDLAVSTKEMYADAVERHVEPGLGRLRLREVNVPILDRFIRTLRERSGAGSAKIARTVVSGMFGLAVRYGAAATNPVRDVSRVSKPRKTVRALTVDESRTLRAAIRADEVAANLELPDLVDFLLATGVRIGEACAVRWGTVDLSAGVLEVNSTATRTREHGVILQERPKTAAGWRAIALPRSIVTLLAARRPTDARPEDVVFTAPFGGIRDRSNTTGDLRRAFDRAGFDWVTSHTLRKTVATRLDDAGLSARQIADHLGHARPSITQDVYLGRKVVTSRAAEALED